MRIGITERGDAAFDKDWIDALNNKEVQAAIIISKGLPEEINQFSNIIFHATTSGYGGTYLEPNVQPFAQRLHDLAENDFPKDRVVIRIDPIIPNTDGIALAYQVAELAYSLGYRRFRYSYLDIYPHVKRRFAKIGKPVPSDFDLSLANRAIANFERLYPDSTWESCGETATPDYHKIGCISKKDLDILGIQVTALKGSSNQRHSCLCPACKTELLNHRGRCPHSCIYCYWCD